VHEIDEVKFFFKKYLSIVYTLYNVCQKLLQTDNNILVQHFNFSSKTQSHDFWNALYMQACQLCDTMSNHTVINVPEGENIVQYCQCWCVA